MDCSERNILDSVRALQWLLSRCFLDHMVYGIEPVYICDVRVCLVQDECKESVMEALKAKAISGFYSIESKIEPVAKIAKEMTWVGVVLLELAVMRFNLIFLESTGLDAALEPTSRLPSINDR